MKHEDWQILVSAYHDGEVTPEEAARVEAHVAECADCAETLAAYRRLGQTIHNLPRGEPSRQLWLRVQEGLRPGRGRSFWWRLLPVASAVAMLAIAVTLIVVLGYRPRGLAPTQPAARRQVQVQATALSAVQTVVVPAAAPAPTVVAQGEISSPLGFGATTLATSAGCPGSPLALEVVGLSIRSDPERSAPGLQGVLYDAQGAPLPGVTLVVSGTAGWVGTAITADDGTFALDLPERGTYRVVMALSPTLAKDQEARPTGTVDYYALPDGAVCAAARDTALAPTTLENQDVAILTLTLRTP